MGVGCVFTAVALAGCLAMAFMEPDAGIGDARIVMEQDSGALYVRIDDVLHPVLNLASARLIAGAADDPRPVPSAALRHSKRGPVLGIPGAPDTIDGLAQGADQRWAVCDGPATTVIAGASVEPAGATGQSVLVRSASSRTPWLLYDGKRAEVDLSDPVVLRALHLEGVEAREVSPALLNALTEVPALDAPRIPDRGGQGPSTLPGFAVGDVFRLERAGATEYYVVLTGGVQRIGRVAADLIRFADPDAPSDITAVAPEAIRTTPSLGALAVSAYPDRIAAPTIGGAGPVCVTWKAGGGGLWLGPALPLAGHQVPVSLAQADGDGPALDGVYVPPGAGMYVAADAGGGYFVSDTGVRFAVADADAARSLGLPDTPVPAPWPILSLLPAGPELRAESASVARDVVVANPA